MRARGDLRIVRAPVPTSPPRRRPWTPPEIANLRTLVLAIQGGCEACGHCPGYTTITREIGIERATLEALLVGDKPMQDGSLERIGLWVWRQINRAHVVASGDAQDLDPQPAPEHGE